ncbi:unnamed protein product [Effrenium voratum]|uniref:EF-hand domain-containing protein n=1 Tax=Effrenium voratum TaxID=2562239 RepID=A0AA36NFM0_9DINO|nr:unnamed protein product [Effrenium voratum]
MVYHERTLSSPLTAFPRNVMQPQAFSQVMHEYGCLGRNVEEKLCLHAPKKHSTKKQYLSPFRLEVTSKWVAVRKPLPEPNRTPRVGHAFHTKEVIARARRLIINAKAQSGLSWDQIFASHDLELSFEALKDCLRRDLAISPKALADLDIQVLFTELDADKSGTVNIKEMLSYVAHGPKRIHDENAMLLKRTARVRRNMNMACRKFAGLKNITSESVSKLFKMLDCEGDGKLSKHEFLEFVREGLGLSMWDVPESELLQFYNVLDKDNDGLDPLELLVFIQGNQEEMANRKLFSFVDTAAHSEDRPRHHHEASAPGQSHVFRNSGRLRPPSMRLPNKT